MSNASNLSGYDYDYSRYDEYKAAVRIWTYGAPVLIVLGTIGNALSLLVMTRKSLRVHTTSLYLSVLAVTDTAVLFTGLMRYWLLQLTDRDVRSASLASCKIHIFLVYLLIQFEAWTLVCVTVERLVSVVSPHRAKSLFTKKAACVQISAAFVLLIAANAHFLGFYTLIDGRCRPTEGSYSRFVDGVWSWLDFVLATLAPFVLMLSMNTAIIIRLLHRQAKRKQTRKNAMTVILLVVNFVFFISTAPIAIYLSTRKTWQARTVSAADAVRLELVWALVNMAAYTNNAINFVLYCLSSPTFRKELSKMMSCSGRSDNRVAPSDQGNSSVTGGS